jgi:hypothetical protein
MTQIRLGAALLTAALATLPAAPAVADANVAGVFSQGRTHLAIIGGSGYAFDQTYFVLGVGAQYYLANGLSLGLHVESWTGDDPGITKITPSVQYVFYQVPRIHPYLGLFYRSTQVEDLPDLESTGGRAGLYFTAGSNAFFGAGVVQETYLDCNESVYRSCSDVYPEVSFTFTF